MTDETEERDDQREAEEHLLDAPDALRQPHEKDDEQQERAPQPGLTPDPDDPA